MKTNSRAFVLATLTIALTLGLVSAASAADKPAGTLTVLHTFAGTPDGVNPNGLVKDSTGNLYGTAQFGGANNFGCVFELSPDGNGGWTYNLIYSLAGDIDGAFPSGALAVDSQGNLYGTDVLDDVYGYGAVFELSKGSNGTWYLSRSYNFPGTFGGKPSSGVTLDANGNVFGTTHSNFGASGAIYGGIFELIPNGNSWTEQTLYVFPEDGSTGEYPDTGNLAMDRSGNLYGMTAYGGSHDQGTIFRLRNAGNGWVLNTLYTIGQSPDDNSECTGSLLMDQFGSLYGTCPVNPEPPITIGGGVFKLTPAASARQAPPADDGWQITWLYHFTGGSDGGGPYGGVVSDNAGNLYGATDTNLSAGVVYKLTRSGSTWSESVLYSFTGGTDGRGPLPPLALDNAGNVYGSANAGGADGAGTLFELAQ